MTTLVIFGATGDLARKKILPALPPDIRVIGVGRRPLDVPGVESVQGDLREAKTYEAIKTRLGESELVLFYLALHPLFYPVVCEHLASSGLGAVPGARILIEKPFGTDGESAGALDLTLGRLFDESRIFRVDHYLAKEELKPLGRTYSQENVAAIEIRTFEKSGVEGRVAFYETAGALRDWHSHHLQVLATLLMDGSRFSVLEHVRLERARRAQYRGYRELEGVDPDSQTETYFRLDVQVDLPRWQGVPITLEAGKGMAENRKEVVVRLREGGGFTIPLETNPSGRGEYETILHDAIAGDRTRFVSTDEVRAMWRFVDPIVRSWQHGAVPLEIYQPGAKL